MPAPREPSPEVAFCDNLIEEIDEQLDQALADVEAGKKHAQQLSDYLEGAKAVRQKLEPF